MKSLEELRRLNKRSRSYIDKRVSKDKELSRIIGFISLIAIVTASMSAVIKPVRYIINLAVRAWLREVEILIRKQGLQEYDAEQ